MFLNDGNNAAADHANLTARLARSERLLKINQLLVAGLIHDLRTPLMAINLSAEVALARSDDAAVQQAARRIRSSSDRMSRVFDHLLNLSRLGDHVSQLSLQPGDLQEATRTMLDGLRQEQPHLNIELSYEGDLSGVFDASMLAQSIGHFIATSTEHADDASRVTIHLDGQHRDRLWVKVSVPGVIPPEVQERLFVPGVVEAGLEVQGQGLGLHAVDAFVRAHGGSVVGKSRAPGGTVFELLLPRDALAAG